MAKLIDDGKTFVATYYILCFSFREKEKKKTVSRDLSDEAIAGRQTTFLEAKEYLKRGFSQHYRERELLFN